MRQLKNQTGSIYIFVMVVSLSVFIMLSAAIGSARYEAAASHAYSSNASLYYLSESGVYKAADTLDRLVLSSSEEGTLNTDEYVWLHAGIHNKGIYFGFLEYKIETVNREGVSMVYEVSVAIRAEHDGAYTILSEASNEAASVKTQGVLTLVYDKGLHMRLTQVKQIIN